MNGGNGSITYRVVFTPLTTELFQYIGGNFVSQGIISTALDFEKDYKLSIYAQDIEHSKSLNHVELRIDRGPSEPPHPILNIPDAGVGADIIMNSWTESQYTNSFVPRQAPRTPSLFAPSVIPGDTGWTWSMSSPNQLISTPSQTIFPNTNYPLHTASVSVLSGKTIDVPYYDEVGNTNSKSFVHAGIDYYKRRHLRKDW